MAVPDVTTSTRPTPNGRHPRLPAGIRAELAETPEGWVLTLHCDAATAAALRAAPTDLLAPGQLNISITPNLVPGEPFPVETVLVAVDETN
jgi:hypothetical protein